MITVNDHAYEGQFGYRTDQTTGPVLAGHRFYQPQTGRWLNRDPIGYDGGMNLYEYCGDDPVNEVDPSGDDPQQLTPAQERAMREHAKKMLAILRPLDRGLGYAMVGGTIVAGTILDALSDNPYAGRALLEVEAADLAAASEAGARAAESEVGADAAPAVLPKLRTYNEQTIPGYDKHHMDPPLGRPSQGYGKGVTLDVRNDNQGGRIPGGMNYHTAKGGFQTAFTDFYKSMGYSTREYNSLPEPTRQVMLRSFWSSLGAPYPSENLISETDMQPTEWNTDSLYSTLLSEFSTLAEVSSRARSTNPEDSSEIKIAVMGFAQFAPSEKWTYQHWQFISNRLDGELSESALRDHDTCVPNFRMFASLCLGALLGMLAASELSDAGFLYGDMHLVSFMSMHYAEICSAAV